MDTDNLLFNLLPPDFELTETYLMTRHEEKIRPPGEETGTSKGN